MYNPFSLYTVIPWSIVINLSEAILFSLADLMIGELFNEELKAILCLILFITNFIYLFYLIIIHFRVIKRHVKRCVPITYTDLFNLLIGSSLTWVWLFLALFFFDHAMYSDVLREINQPHMFFKVYLKFYVYTLIAFTGSVTSIVPEILIAEIAHGIASLYYQILTLLILAGFLSYIMDSLHT